MKRILLYSIFSLLASFSYAEILFYNGINDNSFWGKASTWVDENGVQATNAPSQTSDIIVDFNNINSDMRTVYGAIRTTNLDNLTVNSMTWQNIKTLTLKDKTTGAEVKSSQLRLAIGTWQSTDRPATLTVLNDFKFSAAAGSNVSNILGACENSVPNEAPKIIIGGNLQIGTDETKDVAGTGFRLELGNSASQYKSGYGGPQYFEVGKDIILKGNSSINFNVTNDSLQPTLTTPSVVIKGVIRMETSSQGNPAINLSARSSVEGSAGNPDGIKNNPVFHIGGIEGNVGSIGNYTYSSSAQKHLGGISTIMLTNAAGTDYTFWGTIFDDAGGTSTTKPAQTMIVMNGIGTQRLGGSLKFTGGVKMINGSLLVGANNSDTINHGDLTILGGKFGNGRTVARTWKANNLVIGSDNSKIGEIDLYVGADATFDKIDFVGAALKDISFVDGVSKLKINLSGNANLLISQGEFKIFSFGLLDESTGEIINADSFLDSDFISSTTIEKDGITYGLEFRYDDGKIDAANAGLYAQFVQVVPEASTYALILSAIALAVVIRRKN